MNKQYAKLVDGQLVYAPSSLNTTAGIIMNPKRLSYLQAGWKFLDLQPPAEPPQGKEYLITGYTENHDSIWANYKLVPVEAQPRIFSKLRLVNALSERGIWQACRDWLDASGYYDLFLAAQDFREDHPQFAAALAAARSRFAIDEATLAAILSEAEIA